MRYSPKLNRMERRLANKEKLANKLSGKGVYVYENNTAGDLKLPKPTASGVREIGPKKRFQGDSYYMQLVGPPMNLLRLVEVISPENPADKPKENAMSGEKLILDQPDTITTRGKVEHFVDDTLPKAQPLNDANDPAKPAAEVLLNEQPLAGLEIIKGA
jgi:hypothetical protein